MNRDRARSVLGVPGHLVMLLEVLANGDERRDAITDRRSELLRRATANVAGHEDPWQLVAQLTEKVFSPDNSS